MDLTKLAVTVHDVFQGRTGIVRAFLGDMGNFVPGVDPEFDVVGGSMVAVQENLSRLPAEDREAIAAYLKAIQP